MDTPKYHHEKSKNIFFWDKRPSGITGQNEVCEVWYFHCVPSLSIICNLHHSQNQCITNCQRKRKWRHQWQQIQKIFKFT